MQLAFIFILLFTVINSILSQWDLQDYGVIVTKIQKANRLWGSYKPNLFFALKSRGNTSTTFGVMWYGADKNHFNRLGYINKRIRHECVMEDNLSYRWEVHNGLDYGREVIEDGSSYLNLNATFIKTNYSESRNQSWEALLHGRPKAQSQYDKEIKNMSLVIYLTLDNFPLKEEYSLRFSNNSNNTIIGSHKEEELFRVYVTPDQNTTIIHNTNRKLRQYPNSTWKVKKLLGDELAIQEINANKNLTNTWNYTGFKVPKNETKSANIIALQFIVSGEFSFKITYSNVIKSEEELLSGQQLSELIEIKENEFIRKFKETYPIDASKLGFIKTEKDEERLQKFAIEALSNALGGIGHYDGKIRINFNKTLEPGQWHKGFRYAVEDKELFTGSPSRSFFARGFLWDEGFHNILFSQWDKQLSVDIINTWLSTMSATGWMAREQIRGEEAESTVPEKFITQDNLIGNPPTFIFPIKILLNHYNTFKEVEDLKYLHSFLKKVFDKFSLWYEWYENHQKTPGIAKGFQWYGRNTNHNLASGLDDFPRGMTPNIQEKHLDLFIWVLELMKSIRDLSEVFDPELTTPFSEKIVQMESIVKTEYLDEQRQILADFLGPQFKFIKTKKYPQKVPPFLWRGDFKCGKGNKNPIGTDAECDPYSESPCCSEFGYCGNTKDHCDCPLCVRSTKLEDRSEYTDLEAIFNPHIGYVNMLPLAFGYIKHDESLFRNILNLIKDENILLSPHGIRSLSKSDLLYHTGDDYWRGNIWINMNFLVLRGLYLHYQNDEESQTVYLLIKQRLVEAVFTEWKTTRQFYEQYSDTNGRGLRAHPFNGWTSLLLNILTDKYN